MKRLICLFFGHRWLFARISLEGHKIFRCQRCGKQIQGAYTGALPPRRPIIDDDEDSPNS